MCLGCARARYAGWQLAFALHHCARDDGATAVVVADAAGLNWLNDGGGHRRGTGSGGRHSAVLRESVGGSGVQLEVNEARLKYR